MSTITQGKKNRTKKCVLYLNKERGVPFAIDTAEFNCTRYTVYHRSSARYYPERSPSIKKYFNTHGIDRN